MSATASIPNVSAVAGPANPGAGNAGKAAQPGGFDALLNAFFGPAAGAEGAVDPALAGLLQLGTIGEAVVAAEGAPVEGEGDAATPDADGDATSVDPAAALALLAALAAPTQATTPEVTTATAATEGASKTPVAGGDVAEAELPTFAPAETAQAEVAAKAAETLGKPAAAQPSIPTVPQAAAQPQGAAQPQAALTTSAPPPPAPAPEAAPAQPQAIAQAAVAQAAAAEGPEVAPQPAPRDRTEARSERTEAKGAAPAARTEAFTATPASVAQPRAGGAQPPAGQDAGKPDTNLADAVAPDTVAHEAHAQADRHDASAPAQTASTATAAATPAPTHAAAVRGSPETVASLAAQIVKKLESRSTRFDLELHPAELGRVDVRVEINHQGKLTAAMSFDSPQAANELKARSGELQRALEQAGFDLSGGMSFDVAGDQGRNTQQQLAEQWADRDPGAGFRGRAFRAALDTAGEADSGAASALSLRRGLRSGVDVRI